MQIRWLPTTLQDKRKLFRMRFIVQLNGQLHFLGMKLAILLRAFSLESILFCIVGHYFNYFCKLYCLFPPCTYTLIALHSMPTHTHGTSWGKCNCKKCFFSQPFASHFVEQQLVGESSPKYFAINLTEF